MKYNRKQKKIWLLFIFVGLLVIFLKISMKIWENQSLIIENHVLKMSEQYWLPNVYSRRYNQTSHSMQEQILNITINSRPVLKAMRQNTKNKIFTEDEDTIAMILRKQANEENYMDENGKMVVNQDIKNDTGNQTIDSNTSEEDLKNFDTLLSRFYTVDSTTSIDSTQLDYNELMSRNMKISANENGPKILIYHTHSQEAFADSIPGDPSTSVVGIGGYLTKLLNEKGIETIHDEGTYDFIDGHLDRSKAYDYAKDSITKILSEHPSVEVVIDLHRDGVSDDTHLISEINGKNVAKIMFFNGLSFSSTSGNIEYLYNPFIQDNLAFSFQMKLMCEKMYPGWTRKIYLRAYRYNLDLMPKDLLIEAGAQTNTVEEMKNAMDLLADTLYSVLKG